eukprot:m.293733 g.293733  ORF g.293733 m.293733 type:complete len:92 (+) comp12855_c0_seq1:276-551(+)
MALIMFGDTIFAQLGRPVPEAIANFQDNKFATAAVIFFFSNTICQNILSTGAFEIYVDGELVLSKLQLGYLPDMRTIISTIDGALDASVVH